jgi:Arc/MetJ-type ribon-helix-helix transcriptional regulator
VGIKTQIGRGDNLSVEVDEMLKKRMQVTLREDLVNWMAGKIEKAEFASYSHAIEYALIQLKEREKKT